MTNKKSSLIFNDYVVDYVAFQTNKYFNEDQTEDRQIDVQFNINRAVNYDDDNQNVVYVTLEVSIFEDPVENNYPFSIDLSLTGTFEMQDMEDDQKEYFAKYNTVSILFPYVRALVSNYTANANVPPLIIPPINVLKMLDEED